MNYMQIGWYTLFLQIRSLVVFVQKFIFKPNGLKFSLKIKCKFRVQSDSFIVEKIYINYPKQKLATNAHTC